MAICLSAVSGRPTSGSHVLFKKRSSSSSRWQKQDKAASDEVIPMTIALAQADINLGAHYLEDISNPKSANFGKHWTSQQVKDAFAPSDTTSSAVQTWLTDAGISKDSLTTSTSGGYVKFDATVKQIESLLNTNYHVYKHLDSGKEHIGCDNFQLPSSLKAHIDFIKPTISFPRSFSKHTGAKSTVVKSKALQNRAIDPSCTSNVTPDCIKSEYNML